MEKVINLGIPHIGEKIFENIDTPGLIECALVSETWETLAHNVLLKRTARTVNGRTAFMTACIYGHKNVVKLFLDHSVDKNIDLNAKDSNGLTAFMLTCEIGFTSIMQLFLDYSTETLI